MTATANTRQRWVFSSTELEQDAPNLLGVSQEDEFIASVGTELGVIVCRNGDVSNRWEDGTKGVPKDIADLAADCETLNEPGDGGTCADNWRDVEVDTKGDLVRVFWHQDDLQYLKLSAANVNYWTQFYPGYEPMSIALALRVILFELLKGFDAITVQHYVVETHCGGLGYGKRREELEARHMLDLLRMELDGQFDENKE